MAARGWDTAFFLDEPIPVTKASALWTGTWPGKGQVIWASGVTPNELNPRLNTTLRQPEVIDPRWDADDRRIGWTLFVPSAVVARDRTSTPAPPIPTTLLLGRGGEEVGYGLRFFFERAGTGVLLCLAGREGQDQGGRWNVGITQNSIEAIFRTASLNGNPQVQILAGYSTGYGVVQTINNDLVPLARVKRLVLFDCIYRCDKPALPSGDPRPASVAGDRPEFAPPTPPQRILDELREPFQPSPFNTRRAIARVTSAAPGSVVAAYSATSAGSPRYGLWLATTDPKGGTSFTLLRLGSRPVVQIPVLAELRETRPSAGGWSPSSAYDTLALARYLQLGASAGLVSPSELGRVPLIQAAIARGLPPRGTVFASASTRAVTPLPAGLTATDLLSWASGLPSVIRQSERNLAARIVRDHELVLPGWLYDPEKDLDEFRHAVTLSEFGWELLPS